MNTMNLLYLLKAPVKKLNKLFSIQIQIEKFDKKIGFSELLGENFVDQAISFETQSRYIDLRWLRLEFWLSRQAEMSPAKLT